MKFGRNTNVDWNGTPVFERFTKKILKQTNIEEKIYISAVEM